VQLQSWRRYSVSAPLLVDGNPLEDLKLLGNNG